MLQFLNTAPEQVYLANVVGTGPGTNTCFNSTINMSSTPSWIIDTCAINHMVADLSNFKKFTIHKSEIPKRVYLPNGEVLLS